MEIAVRQIVQGDFAAIWEMSWWPLVKERDTIYLEICQQQRPFSFIAETDEPEGWRVAGAILAGRGDRSAFIYHLWVDPEFEGRGLGSELVRHTERAAERAELDYVWLFTTGSVSFYEKLGYRREPEIFEGAALEYVLRQKKAEVMAKRLGAS